MHRWLMTALFNKPHRPNRAPAHPIPANPLAPYLPTLKTPPAGARTSILQEGRTDRYQRAAPFSAVAFKHSIRRTETALSITIGGRLATLRPVDADRDLRLLRRAPKQDACLY
jgi:hypothetical protein